MADVKIYAGVGSRDTPKDVLETMTLIGKVKAQKGWTLRSGRAIGADQAFEAGHSLVTHERMEIILPKEPFERTYADGRKYFLMADEDYEQAEELLGQVLDPRHWRRIKNNDFAYLAHCRNTQQIHGMDFQSPVSQVFCYAIEDHNGLHGGTATAIKLALRAGIPVYNLYHNQLHDQIRKQLAKHQ